MRLAHQLRVSRTPAKEALERLAQDGLVTMHIRIDLEFHRLIRERGGNRRLMRALDNLQDQIRIVFRTSAETPAGSAFDAHAGEC